MNDDTTHRDPGGPHTLQSYAQHRAEVDLSIEVVLLLVGGVFFLIFGLLLFPIGTGALPYSEGAMYGLFVVLVSMQIITMGKTPFGDLLRSWIVVIAGIVTAIVGTLAIFYPGETTGLIRVLAGAIVLVTGALGLVQLVTAEDRARTWLRVPGVLRHLAVACAAVYALEVVLGVITLVPGVVPVGLTAGICVAFGAALVYLAWAIHSVTARYAPEPAEEKAAATGESRRERRPRGLFGEAGLSVGDSFNVFQGVLLLLLGCLVLFMILGAIPAFNADGQLGLLLVLTSLQMLALGQVVGSTVTRSWPLVAAGLAFAAMGIVSCIVPGVLSSVISPLLGVQNIITGVVLLGTQVIGPTLFGIRHPPAEPVAIPPLVKRLLLVLAATGIVAILFGLNMLAPFLLPGLLGVVAFALFLPILIVVMGLLTLVTVQITRKLG
ncbi:MAG: hypothetical protein GXY82_08850 [Methanospirillum sp.]|nr:hypothetical protein [Methanospirillum sp.]